MVTMWSQDFGKGLRDIWLPHFTRKLKMEDFINQCLQTEAPVTQTLLRDLGDVARPLHAAIGICTEAGELQDAFKKHIFYGRALDETNIKEELGDLLWYIALLCNWLECSFEEVQEMVIAKLRKRYPDKFTTYDALNRNTSEERKVLEGQGTCSADPEEQGKIWKKSLSNDYAVTREQISAVTKAHPEIFTEAEREVLEKDNKDIIKRIPIYNPNILGSEIGIWLTLDLKNDTEYDLVKEIKKTLFHIDRFKELYNKLEQAMIAFDETRPPLKNQQKNVPPCH